MGWQESSRKFATIANLLNWTCKNLFVSEYLKGNALQKEIFEVHENGRKSIDWFLCETDIDR